MKKLLNKLSNSGNLKEETQFTGDEHIDTHVRKQTTLPSEPKVDSEVKMKKSFSLSKATSSRFKETAVESEDFSKKKSSSSGLKKEKTKDKLNESDDKLVMRKSKSMKSPSAMRSPSLKGIFASPSYEHQRDAKGVMDSSDSEEEDDAFVPHHHPDLRDENENDHFNNFSTPIRVPSAPARLASSPSFSSSSPSSPSPTVMVSLNARSASPSPSSFSSGQRTPPAINSSSPPSFTKKPPSHALAPTPHVIVADEFDSVFGTRNPSEGLGTPIKEVESEGRIHSDSRLGDYDGPVEDEEEEVIHQKNKSGLFSFGSNNKPMKLKA